MQISWWTLAIQCVNFLVLVWLLQRFLYKPVQNVIAERRRRNHELVAEADKKRSEAEDEKRHYGEALARIEQERKKVLAEAHASIEAERKKILEDAHRDGAALIQDSKKSVKEFQGEALEALKAQVGDLAVSIASKLLADLGKSVPNEVILARLEAAICEIPVADRRRIDEEIAESKGEVTVTTARALISEEQNTWKQRLEKIFDHDLHVTYKCDPNLLSGAVVRLQHTAIKANWSDQLEQARHAMKGLTGEGNP
jgi:F-type H+-transporting ATPase subunit b